MTKHLYLTLLLGVPLVCAALTSSFVYAWNSLTVDPAPVRADGAGTDTKEGYTVTTIRDGDNEYLAVSTHAPYVGDKEEDEGTPRHFITLYEVIRKTDGEARLVLICSRCIEWDRGFELQGMKPDDNRPSALKRELEK